MRDAKSSARRARLVIAATLLLLLGALAPGSLARAAAAESLIEGSGTRGLELEPGPERNSDRERIGTDARAESDPSPSESLAAGTPTAATTPELRKGASEDARSPTATRTDAPARASETSRDRSDSPDRSSIALDALLGGSSSGDASHGSTSSSSSVQALIEKSALVGAMLLALLGALVLLRRRLPRGAGSGAEWVQVIGRVSLTPRHSVHAIRCGERVIVVGVAGDRMTPLAELGARPERPSSESSARDGTTAFLDGLLGGEENALPAANSPETATLRRSTPDAGELGRSRHEAIGAERLRFGVDLPLDPAARRRGDELSSRGWAFGLAGEIESGRS